MFKKLLVMIITVLLICVGLSGCNKQSNNIPEKTSNPIIINNFQVVPKFIKIGQTANLTWDVTGATSISIDNNIGTVSLNGTRIIQPTKTTNYTLTATNATHNITATTQIIVEDTTPITQTPDIAFIQDKSAGTLVVTKISISGLIWDNIQIIGTATKPTGIIKAGDSITGCSGTVSISWKGTTLLGIWTFD